MHAQTTAITAVPLSDRSPSDTYAVSSAASVPDTAKGIEGIESREEAIAYRSRLIYLHREDIPIPDGAMLIADMIGLPVYHAESRESLGEIKDVSDVAGRRIYTVNYQGRDILLPDVPEFIKEISEECGFASVRHFDREFRSLTGMTPSKYKKMTASADL
jgi:ribosomal 30S subunit maturation factor RimM